MTTWVIGSGGLLGRALARHCRSIGEELLEAPNFPWHEPALATRLLAETAGRLGADGTPWRVIWAAGSATMSARPEAAAAELSIFSGLLDAVGERPGPGSFFLASSAGGAYAGSTPAPFSVASAPVPTSAYGRLKLEQEALVAERLGGRMPVAIGRFANLYGPGQNLAKLQGLVSRLALAAATRTALNVFVPADTMRDYVYVDDAAAATFAALGLAERERVVRIDVIASGRPVTVAHLVSLVGSIAHRRVPIALGSHASAASQALDLRLTPSIAADATGLATGVRGVYLDILGRIRAHELTTPA